MTASEEFLEKLLHQLSKTASAYKQTVSTAIREILSLEGKDLVWANIVINNNTIEQVKTLITLAVNWAVI
jgi:hypothetical protein